MRITHHTVRSRIWSRLPDTPFEIRATRDAEVRCVDGIWYVGAIPGEFLIREVRADGTAGPAREARPVPFRDPAHEVRKPFARYGYDPILCLSLPPAIPLPGEPSGTEDVQGE